MKESNRISLGTAFMGMGIALAIFATQLVPEEVKSARWAGIIGGIAFLVLCFGIYKLWNIKT